MESLPEIDLGSKIPLYVAGSQGNPGSAALPSTFCALFEDHTVQCWGPNSAALGYPAGENIGDEAGEMGSNLTTVDLGTGRTVKSLGAGFGVMCVILDNDKIKCWGNNESGRLGLGDTDSRGDDAGEMGDDLPYLEL